MQLVPKMLDRGRSSDEYGSEMKMHEPLAESLNRVLNG